MNARAQWLFTGAALLRMRAIHVGPAIISVLSQKAANDKQDISGKYVEDLVVARDIFKFRPQKCVFWRNNDDVNNNAAEAATRRRHTRPQT